MTVSRDAKDIQEHSLSQMNTISDMISQNDNHSASMDNSFNQSIYGSHNHQTTEVQENVVKDEGLKEDNIADDKVGGNDPEEIRIDENVDLNNVKVTFENKEENQEVEDPVKSNEGVQ